MNHLSNLISTGKLDRHSLAGQVVVVTGAGGGIGFEAARDLAWLGAKVVIAEINRKSGQAAATQIQREFGAECCICVHTDVGSEESVRHLAWQAERSFGKVDAVLNNATVPPMGAVKDLSIEHWDQSYQVNLRGPVLLARAFLPGMLARNQGVFICVSSVGDKFMGAYESLKAAQVHLARVLSAELEESCVHAFTIGPGLVLTQTATEQIARIAPLYGKTVEEFYELAKDQMLPVEAAGAGFAAAVALAERFRGLEIDARMALNAAGIELPEPGAAASGLSPEEFAQASELCGEVHSILSEQAAGWAKRPLFERQWMQRDFQKYAKASSEQCLEELCALEAALHKQSPLLPGRETPERLAQYFAHYQDLARGYLKESPEKTETLRTIGLWREKAALLAQLVSSLR